MKKTFWDWARSAKREGGMRNPLSEVIEGIVATNKEEREFFDFNCVDQESGISKAKESIHPFLSIMFFPSPEKAGFGFL